MELNSQRPQWFSPLPFFTQLTPSKQKTGLISLYLLNSIFFQVWFLLPINSSFQLKTTEKLAKRKGKLPLPELLEPSAPGSWSLSHWHLGLALVSKVAKEQGIPAASQCNILPASMKHSASFQSSHLTTHLFTLKIPVMPAMHPAPP